MFRTRVDRESGELALKLLQEGRVAIADRRELDAPVACTGEGDGHGKTLKVGRFAQALEPFDCRDPIGEQVIAQAEVVEGDALEAVEVDVKEREAAAMLLDHGEGWAQNLILGKTEATGETFDEAGFADAEIAGESNQFATLQISSEASRPHAGFSRRMAFDDERCTWHDLILDLVEHDGSR
jgi:hypothetical protein